MTSLMFDSEDCFDEYCKSLGRTANSLNEKVDITANSYMDGTYEIIFIIFTKMTKQERIDIINDAPEGSLFLVRALNGMLWKQGDRGYTEDITEARQFSQQEIIDKLQANGFTDKSIEIFTPQQSI